MLKLILGFIGGPIVQGIVDSYRAKLENDGNSDKMVTELATRAVELDSREAEFNNKYKLAMLGRWYEAVNLAGYIFVIYLGSAVLWDNVIYPKLFLGKWGYTGPVTGETAVFLGMVAAFFFGKRLAVNAVEAFAKLIKK